MCDTSSNRGNSSKTRCIKGCKVVSVIHRTGGCKGLQSCQCYTPQRWLQRVAKLSMLYTTQVVAKGCKVVNVIHHTGGMKHTMKE